ncbi:MAG: aldo/keto reductase [Lachnospiraceae bacterium]|nr:aldo/keto reductase [Lachnospiraceae bacterium]
MNYVANKSRYNMMKYKRCGRSGLKLPMISFGLWHNFGVRGNYENMERMCMTAFDCGITHFDLADNYGPDPGQAEKNFGKILNSVLKPYRDEIVITTKAGYNMWEGPYGDWGSRKHLMASIDQSLERLGCDYVDIFYHHRMDSETPLEETMGVLADIVNSGKALYVGVSNYDRETNERAAALLKEMNCSCIVNQSRYSIFDRTIENNGVKNFARDNGIGIVAFSPLAQGLLTDKYLNGIPEKSRIVTDSRFLKKNSLTDTRLKQIAELNIMASERGQTLAQMALAWTIRDSVCSALIGASSPDQIIENLHSLDNMSFTEEELKRIDNISNPKE